MKEKLADLHVHTYYSDGLFSPEKVVEISLKLGLSAVSITDHDCVEGIEAAVRAASGTDLEIIPGIELSSVIKDREVHILGYFIDKEEPVLVSRLGRMKENRLGRMKEIISCLNKNNVDISEEEVFEASRGGTIGRYHLACIMAQKGLIRTPQEAFDKYIGDGKSCVVKHKRLEYEKAIKMITKAGGVPVLAHPGTPNVDKYIPAFIAAGIRGIEVYHSKHSRREIDKYLSIADKNGLLITGGSDCHGSDSGNTLIGTACVGNDEVGSLKQEVMKIREKYIEL